MNCRFCKLDNIGLLEDGVTFKCSYCGYSFEVSRTAILYDRMMKMPLNSWLLASILWIAAMITGVAFGLGFTNAALSTTILFLFIYGASALIYGFSMSLDFFQGIWILIKKIFKRESTSWENIKLEVQEMRKKKIVSEMATGQAVDEATGMLVDTDIRPGEKSVPSIAASFLAGLYTIILGGIFSIIFNIIFPPVT
ncbi:MAG: hypothetical protein KAS63_04130 [Candidatus Heimdallarchaeota archaeon]|nr:hypothetical protein [Candidatus Heimdallarchaeota archaeon]MCK4954523.1 hypothetical protein [Candidatus Heimdallarchaeota archaeon]